MVVSIVRMRLVVQSNMVSTKITVVSYYETSYATLDISPFGLWPEFGKNAPLLMLQDRDKTLEAGGLWKRVSEVMCARMEAI